MLGCVDASISLPCADPVSIPVSLTEQVTSRSFVLLRPKRKKELPDKLVIFAFEAARRDRLGSRQVGWWRDFRCGLFIPCYCAVAGYPTLDCLFVSRDISTGLGFPVSFLKLEIPALQPIASRRQEN